jgi:hypothetical protein
VRDDQSSVNVAMPQVRFIQSGFQDALQWLAVMSGANPSDVGSPHTLPLSLPLSDANTQLDVLYPTTPSELQESVPEFPAPSEPGVVHHSFALMKSLLFIFLILYLYYEFRVFVHVCISTSIS